MDDTPDTRSDTPDTPPAVPVVVHYRYDHDGTTTEGSCVVDLPAGHTDDERIAAVRDLLPVPDEADLEASLDPLPPDLATARAAAIQGAIARGDALEARFLAPYPSAVIKSFTKRESEARAVVAGDLPPSEATLLMKVYGSHQAVTAAAPRVIARAEAMMDVTAAIEKLTAAARAAFEAARTHEELDAAIDDLTARANAAEAEIMARAAG